MRTHLHPRFTVSFIVACILQSTHAAIIVGSPLVTLEIPFVLNSAFTPSKPPGLSQWLLRYGDDRVDIGDIFRFRLFEDSLADVAILDVGYDGTSAQNGFLALFGPSQHFQDLQGLLVIDLYKGSVTIDRLFAETYVSGKRYLFSKNIDIALVPEPAVGIMLVIGVSYLLLRRRSSCVVQSTKNV
jgi:hypothetical protein